MSLDQYLGSSPLVRFGGKADALQGTGSGAALVAELGSNYDQYHAELQRQYSAAGGARPDRNSFLRNGELDHDAYSAACRTIGRLLRAEVFLRACANRHNPSLGDLGPIVTPTSALRAGGSPPEATPEPPPVPIPDWDPRAFPPRGRP